MMELVYLPQIPKLEAKRLVLHLQHQKNTQTVFSPLLVCIRNSNYTFIVPRGFIQKGYPLQFKIELYKYGAKTNFSKAHSLKPSEKTSI